MLAKPGKRMSTMGTWGDEIDWNGKELALLNPAIIVLWIDSKARDNAVCLE